MGLAVRGIAALAVALAFAAPASAAEVKGLEANAAATPNRRRS